MKIRAITSYGTGVDYYRDFKVVDEIPEHESIERVFVYDLTRNTDGCYEFFKITDEDDFVEYIAYPCDHKKDISIERIKSTITVYVSDTDPVTDKIYTESHSLQLDQFEVEDEDDAADCADECMDEIVLQFPSLIDEDYYEIRTYIYNCLTELVG